MLKCTCGMNEVDAYVEHGVHQYTYRWCRCLVRCAFWGDQCAESDGSAKWHLSDYRHVCCLSRR